MHFSYIGLQYGQEYILLKVGYRIIDTGELEWLNWIYGKKLFQPQIIKHLGDKNEAKSNYDKQMKTMRDISTAEYGKRNGR